MSTVHNNLARQEVLEHLRFTIISVLLSVVIVMVINLTSAGNIITQDLFKKIHFLHLFFAAMTPVAIYYLYNPDRVKAIGIGILSASIGCTLSDSVFPYLGGTLLDYKMTLHICLLSEPYYAWPSLLAGCAAGILLSKYFKRFTHGSHFFHTLIASAAALVYLITFGGFEGSYQILFIIVILVFSVMLPCLFSDFVIPSLVVSNSSMNKILNTDAG